MNDETLSTRAHMMLFRRTLRLLNQLAPGITVMQFLHAFCRALIPFIAIFMSAKIIDELAAGRDPQKLAMYVVITIGSTLLATLLQGIFGSYVNRMKVKITAQQEMMMASKMYALDYANAESKEIHALRKLIETHAETGVGGLFSAIWFSNNLLRYASAVGIALSMSIGMFFGAPWWMVTLMTLAIVGAIALFCRNWLRVNKAIRKLYEAVSEAKLLYDFYMVNYMDDNQAAKDIRVYRQSTFINQELHQRMYAPQIKARKMQIQSEGNNSVLTVGLTTLLGGAVYLFVALQAWNGKMGIGDVMRYYGAVTQLIAGSASLIVAFFALMNNNFSLKHLFQYLDLPEPRHRDGIPMPKEHAAMEFHDVAFRYAPDSPLAVEGINLRLEPGEHVAIVGRNGSGKTTLVKLMCRLYQPTQGKITLNGIDIHAYDFDAFQASCTAVFQDFKLFSFGVAQNVSGRVDYDPNRVWEAVSLSGLRKRIEKLPKQLEQAVYKDFEEDGVEFSGGEEQKLAIARALYKDALFMILDEPTAALDPFSEEEVYDKFEEIVGPKTAVYISHRLSSCKFCDRIIVMEKGRIVQIGTHADLLEDDCGEYAQLWQAQAQHYQRE